MYMEQRDDNMQINIIFPLLNITCLQGAKGRCKSKSTMAIQKITNTFSLNYNIA